MTPVTLLSIYLFLAFPRVSRHCSNSHKPTDRADVGVLLLVGLIIVCGGGLAIVSREGPMFQQKHFNWVFNRYCNVVMVGHFLKLDNFAQCRLL